MHRFIGFFLLFGLLLAPAMRGDAGGTGSWIGFGSTLQANPANPAGTTSSSFVHMGTGSTCQFTPKYADRVLVGIVGDGFSSAAGDGVIVGLRYGTGSAPAFGAAATGTPLGSIPTLTSTALSNRVTFKLGGVITGLTLNTPLWIDIIAKATPGGGETATVENLSCFAVEL